MPYCTENDVYDATGFTSAKIVEITQKSTDDITTLIEGYITKAEQTIKDWVKSPHLQRREMHRGDGEKTAFDLGTEDEEDLPYLDPTGDVNKVYAIYEGNYRKKLPHPKADCDLGCENESSSWGSSNCTISDESTTIACQSYSIKGIFSAAGYMRYPSTEDLNKNINIFGWMAFRFRSSSAARTFTVYLYDRSGNSDTYSLTVHKADVWYIIMIQIDDFTGSVDWENENLYYLDIYSDGACTVYVENLNFNDGIFWTQPQGQMVYCHKEKPVYANSSGQLSENAKIYITYDYDPFNTTVPENIKEACACLAGVKLLDLLLGYRMQDTTFIMEADEGTIRPDKTALEIQRRRLKKRAEEKVGEYGFGFYSGIA